MSKQAALCLNMIVKDEAAIVEQLIDSVAAHVGYYVVCDTGSTDGTIERIRTRFLSHGIDGEIHSIPFSNFSQARNTALERGRASKGCFEYFLLADADMELIVDDPKFARQLSKPAYSVKQESGSLGYYTTRIVRADVAAEYIGATHEYLEVDDVTRLNGVRFLHHASGSSRANKIPRDLELLLAALKENPDDSRAMFYLAQTCCDAGRLQEAAEWYELRTRCGGSEEERWYARYQLALCYLALKDNGKFVSECLRAYSERPWRIEPLYQLARYHRLEGMHDAAKLFLLEAQKTPYPSEDNLFINEEIFRTGMKEELSYAGLYSAVDMFGKFDARKIDLQPPPGFCALNPSIATQRASLRCIVRTSNFMNGTIGNTDNADDTVRTQNFLVELSDSFDILSSTAMVDRTGRTAHPNKIQGYEDCRLFFVRDKMYCTATVRDNHPDGLCEIALLCFDAAGSINDVHILRSPKGSIHEKNWVPLVEDDQLFFVYTTAPTVLLGCNLETGELKELSVKETKLRLEHLRGGSQAIRVDDGWLYVTHQVVESANSERSYLHRFVLLDSGFDVSGVSDPFFFLQSGIEYCAGLTLNKATNQLLVSFGLNDRLAYIGSLDLGSVLSRLRKG